jgi:alkylation response protein AidB-like acyl-CoA dehydrogenase
MPSVTCFESLMSLLQPRTTRAALKVCREAIQLHGAIGCTDEADIGLFLRKVLTLMNTCGSLQYHQQRYAA